MTRGEVGFVIIGLLLGSIAGHILYYFIVVGKDKYEDWRDRRKLKAYWYD